MLRKTKTVVGTAVMMSALLSASLALPQTLSQPEMVPDSIAAELRGGDTCPLGQVPKGVNWCGTVCYCPGVGCCEFWSGCGYVSLLVDYVPNGDHKDAGNSVKCADGFLCPSYYPNWTKCGS